MNAPASLSKIEQIRARDGDACWLCTRPLDFSAAPNSKKAPTVEHLVAKSLGGGGHLTNLVLCHQACNLHLADRPLAKKQEMRVKFHANAAKMAIKVDKCDKAASSKAPETVAIPQMASPTSYPPPSLASPQPSRCELRAEIAYWRRLTLIGGGVGLVSFGFATGLCFGLLAF